MRLLELAVLDQFSVRGWFLKRKYSMKDAVLKYIKNKLARQRFIAAAESSFAHYKETGHYITLEEFSKSIDRIQKNPSIPVFAHNKSYLSNDNDS
jgi:hypothetical protein